MFAEVCHYRPCTNSAGKKADEAHRSPAKGEGKDSAGKNTSQSHFTVSRSCIIPYLLFFVFDLRF
jgi:hypothetical protein